jgi:hypothetical protein
MHVGKDMNFAITGQLLSRLLQEADSPKKKTNSYRKGALEWKGERVVPGWGRVIMASVSFFFRLSQ